jgi:hypothetical protein
MENKEPIIIYIKKSQRPDFDILLKDSIFKEKENKHVFLLAMLIGFKNGIKIKLTDRDSKGFFRTEYLSDREKALIKAIAIADQKSLLILKDKKKVYSIVEEYAAGGIKILKDKVTSGEYGSFIKKFEAELLNMFKKIK